MDLDVTSRIALDDKRATAHEIHYSIRPHRGIANGARATMTVQSDSIAPSAAHARDFLARMAGRWGGRFANVRVRVLEVA